MKTSIRHDSIAWLSQFGSGDKVFIPLAQSSSIELNLQRVTHKGIGTRNLVGNYRYKDDNCVFNVSVLASNERTFGTQLTRSNLAYENYVSGSITGFNLSGCQSALYSLSNDGGMQPLNMYSLYDEQTNDELALEDEYSGVFLKFEDCLINNYTLSAAVGQMVSVEASYAAQDVLVKREGLDYVSGVNGYYEAVRPADVQVFINYTGGGIYTQSFSIQSAEISLPIQYKQIEAFGAAKPSARKIILPALGSLKLDGIPVEFLPTVTSLYEDKDSFADITILIKTKRLRGAGLDDYCAIRIPKTYLDTQSLDAAVNQRLGGSMTFSFFEAGEEYSAGKEGLFFLRKIPDVVSYYAA